MAALMIEIQSVWFNSKFNKLLIDSVLLFKQVTAKMYWADENKV